MVTQAKGRFGREDGWSDEDSDWKELPTQSHSTCSDGSLLSMGSSEMDEDSLGQHSGHSSKLSLHEKKMLQDPDPEPDLELRVSATPLSHSAARHKMAVRPRRTHGAPRRRQRLHQLPATLEVLEEGAGRAGSPEARQMLAQTHAAAPHHPAQQQNRNGILARVRHFFTIWRRRQHR